MLACVCALPSLAAVCTVGNCIGFTATYVDIFSQELVRNAVLVDDIVVHAGARRRRTEKEAEQSV